jgi:hypothetical protein
MEMIKDVIIAKAALKEIKSNKPAPGKLSLSR